MPCDCIKFQTRGNGSLIRGLVIVLVSCLDVEKRETTIVYLYGRKPLHPDTPATGALTAFHNKRWVRLSTIMPSWLESTTRIFESIDFRG